MEPTFDADAERAAGLEVGAGAVAPDGVGALVRVAGRLVAAGVHDLEVVDDAVGLVEDAVAVDAVAVLLVEGLQVVLDLRSSSTGCPRPGAAWLSTHTASASRTSALLVLQTMLPQ